MTNAKEFASRILLTASGIARPGMNVAIYEAYSAYGHTYPDAGSLDSFKTRIVEAARARHLSLARCDLPQAMDAEIRELSATEYHGETLHYVDTSTRSSH